MARNDLGDRIYKQRISLNLSAKQLAQITNMTVSTICRLETKELKYISQENFDKLSTVIDLSGYEDYIFRDTSIALGNLIRKKRQEKGYSQTELSQLAGYKDPSTISKLESGRSSKIQPITFLRLQDALSLNEEEFELYITEARTKQKRNIELNISAFENLVKSKRTSLALDYTQLAKRAHVSTNSLYKIEHEINNVRIFSVIRVMRFLKFSQEEIEQCIPNLEDEYIEYILEQPKVFQKHNSNNPNGAQHVR